MNALGDSCCVTGNYHEDTAVLKEADVGVKMGADSSFSAIDASNVVLREGRMQNLMNAIIYGRNMIVNVRKFIEFELTCNLSIMIIIIITSTLNKECPFS